MAKKKKVIDTSCIWENLCGTVSKERGMELKKLLDKHPELSKEEIYEHIRAHPNSYKSFYGIIEKVDEAEAYKKECIRLIGSAIRRILTRLPNDTNAGRSFRVFESVMVKDTNRWVVKNNHDCALDEFYRKQILDRHEIRRKTCVIAIHTYGEYAMLINKL